MSKCKECKKASSRKNHAANRNRNNARSRQYREDNAEALREYDRQRYHDNIDEYRRRRRETGKRRRHVWAANRKRRLAADPELAASVRERRRTADAVYRAKNRTAHNEEAKRYHKRNPHVGHKARAKSRALEAGAAVVEEVDPRVVLERDGGRCRYCGKTLVRPDFHMDHVIPIGRGEHSYDNVVASCASCNSKKGQRTPEEAGMKLRPC